MTAATGITVVVASDFVASTFGAAGVSELCGGVGV
jgi:hypothetical protein